MATLHSPAGRHISRWLFVTDLLVLFALYNVAYRLRMGEWIQTGYPLLFTLMGLILLTLYVMDVYRAEFPVTKSRLPLRAATGVLLAGLVTTAFIYARGPGNFVGILGRGVLPVTLLLFAAWVAYSRHQVSKWAETWSDNIRWLCVGSEERVRHFEQDYASKTVMDALIYPERRNVKLGDGKKFRVLGGLEQFDQLDKSRITGIILALDGPLPDQLSSALMRLRLKGMLILELSEFYEQFMSKLPIFHLKDGWFVYSQGFNLLHNDSELRFKRIIDLIASFVGLLLFSPVMLLAALGVMVSSRGGAIYAQTRTGLNGKPFRLYKLRTMVADAESQGARWASKYDPRVTALGRILRKTRIDELPQLWNVFRGDMSFIGPRPERPEFNAILEHEIPYYELRYLVKPGITGWAQVMYPYGSSSEDARRKLEYDMYYVKNYSLILDFAILLKTFRIVLLARGR